MHKFIFIICFIYPLLNGAFAQQANIDSLIEVVNKPPEDTNKVIAYRMLAGSLRLTQPARAIEYGKAGVQLGKKINFDKGVAGCYLNISTCYNNLGKIDSGLSYIDTAIIYSRRVGDPNRLALAYLNRGDYYMQLQNFVQSLKNCDTALQYAEQANSDDRRARVFQTFGSIYFFQKLYTQSISYYNKANELYGKINNLQMSAIVLNNIAGVYINTGDYKNAALSLQQAITIADSLHDISNLSLYHGTLSDVYFNAGNYLLAEKYANTAMQYAQQMKNDISVGNAWQFLGQVYLKQNKKSEAIAALTNGYAIFKKLSNNEKIHTSAGILSEAYAASGNYAKAYEFLTISRITNDTLVKQRYDNDIVVMQTKFKVDEKDKEILLLAKDKELQTQKLRQQWSLMIAAGALALLIFIGIWVQINRNRLKQRLQQVELRNQIATDLHDEVGSSLSSIHMLGQMAIQDGNNEKQRSILVKMSSNAKETMDKMGDIVWMIKPGETGEGSLKQRMERFAYEICSSKNIEVLMRLDELEKLKLTMEQRKNIYLIFKEAINNAVKYSGTEKIEVTGSLQNKQLALQVEDFGKGFEINTIERGNGLDNMQHRAKELKGDIKIISAQGKGTQMILTMTV